MTNQRRTIVGAIEYTLGTMQQLKRDLQNVDAVNSELNWAIGGIVATLTSNLLETCDEVFNEASASGEPNAKADLLEIKERFNNFIDKMASFGD